MKDVSDQLCACGCGRFTFIAARNDPRNGSVKGAPSRRLPGHRTPREKASGKACKLEGCESPARGRGWCSMHYSRWRKYGDPEITTFVAQTGCKVEGCGGAHFGLGYCAKHYTRMKRHGNLLGLYPCEAADVRFWMKVDKAGECWTWTAGRGDHGYGSFTNDDGGAVSAHRFSYELHYGPIPDGMVVCHRCDNPPCVRPEHLSIGTQADNVQDMFEKGRAVSGWAIRSHCSNGHLYDEANTRFTKHGHRKCRACAREYSRKSKRSAPHAR